MSGKKRSEVETVLKNADSSRKEIFDNIIKDIENSLKEIKNIDTVGNINIEKELKKLNNEKKRIEKTNKKVKNLEKQMQEKSSSHYMDDEFEIASKILGEYESISKNLSIIKKNITKTIDDAIKRHLEQKDQANKKISLLENEISSISYSHPLNNKTLNIDEICDEIIDDKNAANKMFSILNKLKLNYKNDNFDQVIKESVLLEREIENFKQKTQNSYLKIKENIATAAAIYDTLGNTKNSKVEGLGYKLEVKYVDDKIARGIIIKTLENDDISFTLNNNNNIIESDKIDIDMFIGGDCKTKVEDIQSKLAQLGINLNVTDWGSAGENNPTNQKSTINQKVVNKGSK